MDKIKNKTWTKKKFQFNNFSQTAPMFVLNSSIFVTLEDIGKNLNFWYEMPVCGISELKHAMLENSEKVQAISSLQYPSLIPGIKYGGIRRKTHNL